MDLVVVKYTQSGNYPKYNGSKDEKSPWSFTEYLRKDNQRVEFQ